MIQTVASNIGLNYFEFKLAYKNEALDANDGVLLLPKVTLQDAISKKFGPLWFLLGDDLPLLVK